MVGEGVAAPDAEADAAGGGVGAAEGVADADFLIAASFAAISAFFLAMRASADSYSTAWSASVFNAQDRDYSQLNWTVSHEMVSERAQEGYSTSPNHGKKQIHLHKIGEWHSRHRCNTGGHQHNSTSLRVNTRTFSLSLPRWCLHCLPRHVSCRS